MATNFTNKYMQVFQNYNEFGEHSADYVRGEDHIAFLIEENEVIYWLYLEQVWRPLNVRTTTTGELEDGRTKVAVRLEYVEGGQKYTSVPNIPDPERITSMSHFLEDYPDIEEVNVSGTVNLTDLSYAFAGSKIKDFSMLDTSNVNNINHFIDNVDNENINISLSIKELSSNNEINNATLKGLSISKNSSINNHNIKFNDCTIRDINGNFAFYVVDGNNIDNITGTNVILSGTEHDNIINNLYATSCTISILNLSLNTSININSKKIIITDSNTMSVKGNNRYNVIQDSANINFDFYSIVNNNFGYGILANEPIFNLSNNPTIGNFWFTTPIVDDAFYAKYNHPISIFQYKTTFEEIADVNISNEVDSSLIYCDWNINFNVSNVNVEIYNYIKTIGFGHYITFNKFIIDNTNSNKLINLNNIAYYSGSIRKTYLSAKEELRISGKYNLQSDKLYIISAYKNIIVYNCDRFSIVENIIDTNNIRLLSSNESEEIKYPTELIVSLMESAIIEINNLTYTKDDDYTYMDCAVIEDNYSTLTNDITLPTNIRYSWNNVKDDYDAFIFYRNSIIDSNYPLILKNNSLFNLYRTKYGLREYPRFDYYEINDIDTIYIECDDTSYISNLIGDYRFYTGTNKVGCPFTISNIRGVINIQINNDYERNVENVKYVHIDVNKVNLDISDWHITHYTNLDNETLINFITKLVDNTNGYTQTIYMYRSQSNIIGEENITAAVAKNYEFAIIEN